MTGFGSVKQAASVVRHGALAAAIAVAAFSSAAVAEERPVFLDRKQLACIVEHLDAYLALEGDPLVIVVDSCPSVGQAHLYVEGRLEDNLTVQRSANVSATRNAPPQPEIYAAPILIVSREQLTCLAARYATLKPTRSTDGIEVVRVDTLDCM